jgi:2-oxoglutarate ferredoxin oxidoreductase subunit beta
VVLNNAIYGMTGGQASPATHEGDISKTSPYGNAEPAFDICELARAAGATFVARGTPYSYTKLAQLIAAGIVHKGFSFIEVVSTCPTYYGRQNAQGDAVDMLCAQKGQAVPVARYEAGQASLREKYPVGVLHHAERPEFIEVYEEVRRRAQR